jgi:predicted dehydrogenase
MPTRLRWGVLSTARIAKTKVIPAMQGGTWTQIVGIASRDHAKARAVASELGIPKAFGSYEALLADPEIDAVYNALPNHLHVPWSIRAAEAGKHVLCEKPVGLDVADAERLLVARDRHGVYVQEAFMVRTHPQWERAVELCRNGALGETRGYLGAFSYFNDDPGNIRNVATFGGGGLMDIGCYLVMTSRLIFGQEPTRACALLSKDATSGVDTLTSLMLEFPSGQAVGVCGTRMAPHQRVLVMGTHARLEIEIPFNAPPLQPTRLWLDDGSDLQGKSRREIVVPACDQYREQGDRLSRAIVERTTQPYPLEESVCNMRAIDALFRSARTRAWEAVA